MLVVLVLDLVIGDEVHPVGTVHGELAIAEDGGVVLEEGLELALALVVLAYLEEEPFDVGVVVHVVVVRPQTIGVPSAVVGASLLMMVLLDSVLSSSEDMTAKREVAEDRTRPTSFSPTPCAPTARASTAVLRVVVCLSLLCVGSGSRVCPRLRLVVNITGTGNGNHTVREAVFGGLRGP